MWVIHACLSSVLAAKAPCNPTSWVDVLEVLAFFSLAIVAMTAGWLALGALLEWLDGLF